MDEVRAASPFSVRLPREIVLARFVERVKPIKGDPEHARRFATQLEFSRWATFVVWDGQLLMPEKARDELGLKDVPDWIEPQSHHIAWSEGEDFISALKRWPVENRTLAYLFSEPGLAHLRMCNVKVLRMILFDFYVGEPEIREDCPADTLNERGLAPPETR